MVQERGSIVRKWIWQDFRIADRLVFFRPGTISRLKFSKILPDFLQAFPEIFPGNLPGNSQ
jgi:hypothetical protein